MWLTNLMNVCMLKLKASLKDNGYINVKKLCKKHQYIYIDKQYVHLLITGDSFAELVDNIQKQEENQIYVGGG